jgi:eukaryotic-like serine/threonine-protein kinase
MKCPHCGTESKPGEHFCEECGAHLDETGTVAPGNGAVPPAAGLVPGTSPLASEETTTIGPGARLQTGRYVTTKALGEGGMGTVLLAKDTRLADKPTVIKVLSADEDDKEKLQEDVRNFKREVETLAHLDHPLIPDVTDHFEEGLRYYMVMDYVEGENLEHWLDRTHHPMQEEDAIRYGLEVLDILEYLSKQHPAIVHRDIKPANLIIGTKDKHIHLVDFGIARANVGHTHKTTALGTPGYAPPEQYQGYADPRSDLYALAATLHHMLTNRDPSEYAPFQFPPVRTLNPQISPELEQILSKALKTNAGERYQTPQEMRQDMEALLAGTSLLGTTDTYKVSGSLPPRVLAPQTPRKTTAPARSNRDSFESVAQAGERARQNQQRQERGYDDFGSYNEQQTRFEQPRQQQIFEQPTFQERVPYQRQEPYSYQRPMTQRDAENQLMWRFIIFVVAICAIGILAYFLFSSIRIF